VMLAIGAAKSLKMSYTSGLMTVFPDWARCAALQS
jgi:hypothetical protein